MLARFRSSFLLQMALAVSGGVVAGGILSVVPGRYSAMVQAARACCQLVGFISLTWMRALAVPLIVSSVVLGAVGLEPMRALGKVAAKTVAWMVGSSLAAVLIALAAARCVPPSMIHPIPSFGPFRGDNGSSAASWTGGCLGLVLVSLAFGYYRNQLEEGHGRLLTRFCQGLEGMLTPLLRWSRALVAITVFAGLVASGSTPDAGEHRLSGLEAMGFGLFILHGSVVLLIAGAAYLLALSLAVWWLARIRLGRWLGALAPAIWLAAFGNSVEATLPLTFDAVRSRVGVSNRVTSVTLSLCTALHRDGFALCWAAGIYYLGRCGAPGPTWETVAGIGLLSVLSGCGLGALTARTGGLLALFTAMVGWKVDAWIYFAIVEGVAASVGPALSVLSHACATAVIARSEGEFWVPGPPPPSDELQGLKADLDTAEG